MSVQPEGIATGQVHDQTNHYIKESRPYFPDTKLPTYFDFPFVRLASLLLLFASFFGALSIIKAVPNELPLGFFFACALFFLIYCQHEWVNQKSLPVVQTQPVFNGQQLTNNFYEVTITELKGMALANYQAGVGFVQLTQGKIKFQAFNEVAIERMSGAKRQSRVLLFFFFAMAIYNIFYTVVAYSKS